MGIKLDHYHEVILIIGWNYRTRNIVDRLLLLRSEIKIVVIDSTLVKSPTTYKQIEFIYGDPMYEGTLKKAKIDHFHTAIITADRHSPESKSDSHVIITLLAIKALNPSIYSICEIISESQIEIAKRAGADNIINTSKAFANMALNKIATL